VFGGIYTGLGQLVERRHGKESSLLAGAQRAQPRRVRVVPVMAGGRMRHPPDHPVLVVRIEIASDLPIHQCDGEVLDGSVGVGVIPGWASDDPRLQVLGEIARRLCGWLQGTDAISHAGVVK
jgi:hypothetical protein